MKIKHVPLIALCTMATTIVAMGANSKHSVIPSAQFLQSTAETELLMSDARQLAKHLGCTEQGCIDDAMILLNENQKEVLELSDPVEIEDDFASSDANETICQWSSEPPSYQYPNFKYKIWNTSCVVTRMPGDPYPDNVETWFQKKEWRINYPDEWKAYTNKVRVARRNATYFMPFDEDQCDELGGTKSRFYQVPYRYARVVEMKNCPLSYPEDLAELSPEAHDDNSGKNKADDIYVKKVIVHGQVNPVKHFHNQFNVGEVPSALKDNRVDLNKK